MATHRISILGHSTIPDDSGNVFPDVFTTIGASDYFKHMNFVFKVGTTKDSLFGTFNVPKNYGASAANLIVIWTALDATGNEVVWDFEYRAVSGNDTESLDQATSQEVGLSVTDAGPSANFERLETSIALTHGNFAVDDTVEFIFSRDGTEGDDDMDASAILFGLLFEYDD